MEMFRREAYIVEDSAGMSSCGCDEGQEAQDMVKGSRCRGREGDGAMYDDGFQKRIAGACVEL